MGYEQVFMKNVYELIEAKVTRVIEENSITKTLYFRLSDQSEFKFLAGQFMMIGLPGFGECPISISSNPKQSGQSFSLTIRSVGDLTEKLINLKKGDSAWVRGPFGNGFPEIEKNLILIGGGCGYIPLRAVIEEYKNKKGTKLQVFIGCKTRDSLVFKDDYKKIQAKHDFNLIMEKDSLAGLTRGQGFVTDLIKKKKLLKKAKIFICGPEMMYRFVVKELLKKGIEPKNIFLSLEKRMHCGIGVCQHCAIGPKYICKDGPVFSYEFLQNLPNYKY